MRAYDPRSAPLKTYIMPRQRALRIAEFVNGRLLGENIEVDGVATYSANCPSSLSYQSVAPAVVERRERAVICRADIAREVEASTKILVDDPREAFIRFLFSVHPDWERTVAAQAEALGIQRGKSAVHETAVVERGAIIGKGCVIEPLAVIKRGTIVGEDSYVAAGAILGAQGPALHKTKSNEVLSLVKVHFGTLHIGRNVEIGAASVVLRGILGRTYIGENTILGNMVHIGHGAEVRENVWMAARVTICGHAFIDSHVSIGAGATVRDNVDIGRAASVGMGSVVVRSVQADTSVVGVPAKEQAGDSSRWPNR